MVWCCSEVSPGCMKVSLISIEIEGPYNIFDLSCLEAIEVSDYFIDLYISNYNSAS